MNTTLRVTGTAVAGLLVALGALLATVGAGHPGPAKADGTTQVAPSSPSSSASQSPDNFGWQ